MGAAPALAGRGCASTPPRRFTSTYIPVRSGRSLGSANRQVLLRVEWQSGWGWGSAGGAAPPARRCGGAQSPHLGPLARSSGRHRSSSPRVWPSLREEAQRPPPNSCTATPRLTPGTVLCSGIAAWKREGKQGDGRAAAGSTQMQRCDSKWRATGLSLVFAGQLALTGTLPSQAQCRLKTRCLPGRPPTPEPPPAPALTSSSLSLCPLLHTCRRRRRPRRRQPTSRTPRRCSPSASRCAHPAGRRPAACRSSSLLL